MRRKVFRFVKQNKTVPEKQKAFISQRDESRLASTVPPLFAASAAAHPASNNAASANGKTRASLPTQTGFSRLLRGDGSIPCRTAFHQPAAL